MKKNYILFLLTVLFAWVGHAQTTLTQSVDPVNVTDGGVAVGLLELENIVKTPFLELTTWQIFQLWTTFK